MLLSFSDGAYLGPLLVFALLVSARADTVRIESAALPDTQFETCIFQSRNGVSLASLHSALAEDRKSEGGRAIILVSFPEAYWMTTFPGSRRSLGVSGHILDSLMRIVFVDVNSCQLNCTDACKHRHDCTMLWHKIWHK
jgi:hypothetical protein